MITPREGGVKVAIVGSRNYSQLSRVRAYVLDLPKGTVIVSGGAVGVDSEAARAAREAGHELVEHLPDYPSHGRRAPLMRNALIVRDCDRLVAFWDGRSTGTMHTVNLAKKAGKVVDVWSIPEAADVG